jgi:hypothetical protein
MSESEWERERRRRRRRERGRMRKRVVNPRKKSGVVKGVVKSVEEIKRERKEEREAKTNNSGKRKKCPSTVRMNATGKGKERNIGYSLILL